MNRALLRGSHPGRRRWWVPLAGSLLVGACASDGPESPAARPGSFTVQARVIEKTGRCHTVQTLKGGELYAVDPGVLSRNGVGDYITLRARAARAQTCAGAMRLVALSVEPWRQPVAGRPLLRRPYRPRAVADRGQPVRLPVTGGARSRHTGERLFRRPRTRGYPLDWCYRFGDQCNLRAASAYCRRQGYGRAIGAATYVARATRVHVGGRICRTTRGRTCRAYRLIRCGSD